MDILFEIRDALKEATHGKMGDRVTTVDENLLEMGLTSHQIVQWMIGIEEALDIEFPDDQLNRETFASISSVHRAVETQVR